MANEWNEIVTESDLTHFMESVIYFHDSCIKEMKYVSGAYVNDNLSMHPINDQRILDVIIQRQFEDLSMIELQFSGLKYLYLRPATEEYTCEILDAAMFFKDGDICWCDSGDVSEADLQDYGGTVICASKVRWRVIENKMGKNPFYVTAVS